MGLSHEEYLQRTLITKKMELNNLEIDRRIAMAEFETKKNMLSSQIDSLERQLSK